MQTAATLTTGHTTATTTGRATGLASVPITPATGGADGSPAPVVPLRRDAYGRLVALPRRERARRGEGDKLRAEILEAAEYLLARYGHDDAVSIRAVANRVGCTPPAIYLHFEDKTQLLFEVCARRFADLSAHIESAVSHIEDPVDRLQAGCAAYISFGLEHPEHYRILFMQKPLLTPEQWEDLRLGGTTGFDNLLRRVSEAVEDNKLNGEPKQIAVALWQMCHGIVSLMIAKPNWGWDEVDSMSDHLLGTYFRGVRVS